MARLCMPASVSDRLTRIGTATAALCLGLCPLANASIATLDDNAELVAFVWDPVKEFSYSLDLGINVNDFRITAQQDTGIQQFWKIDISDPHFATLRSKGTPVTQLRWAVIAVDSQNDTFTPGDRRAFTTLQQGPADGVIGDAYSSMVGLLNGDFGVAADRMGAYALDLNAGSAENPTLNNHSPNGATDEYAWNGSSVDDVSSPGYFGPTSPGGSAPSTYWQFNAATSNFVGKSSWFYGVTDSGDDSFATVAVDEFDNIAHDGYWGMALNPADGSFALSYTLQAAGPTAQQQEFALSIGRGEYNGGFSVRRLAYDDSGATPQGAGDFSRRTTLDLKRPLHSAAVSAVPEPGSWALMLAGLAGVAAFARRGRR